MLYRLHTQDKNRKWIINLVSDCFEGFSVSQQIGYWRGKKEKSLCIEISANTAGAAQRIASICRAICGYNNQECILVQRIDVEDLLIGESGVL